MGTLFTPRQRKLQTVQFRTVDNYLTEARKLAEKHKVSVADVIAAGTLLEQARRNDLAVAGGDVLDEQLKGFGALLQDLIEKVRKLKS
ncbi:hypothetical protein WS51_12680 [Burkholderia territorii]|uniref:hypothetical protein n=1 Tax=Burkholderia territorii TaxID=1503055 RepID=UPI000842026B|nr:hypothetical protein [Burkholderia territorii]AOI64539.1 hypothetical protein WS51_12680 [Burkholderia territorii]